MVAITVYRFGTPVRHDWPDDAQEQLRLAHDLRNKLVEIERDHESRVQQVWQSFPAFVEAQHAVDTAAEHLAELRQRAKDEHVIDRSRDTRPDTKKAISAARADLRDAKRALKQVRDEVYPHAKPQMVAARKERDAQIKGCYADFVQGRGLFWATYNDVVDSHRTAVRNVAQRRRQGRPAQMRFHRWTGEGTITVQLQRSKDHPPRSPEMLASGEGPWRNVLQLRPWVDPETFDAMSRSERRRIAKDGELRMRINSSGGELTLPVRVHRMMPADADVALVQVTRRRVGPRFETSVALTLRIPEPQPRKQGPAVAVHLGWRALPNGDLRVATLASTKPLPPPISDDTFDAVVAAGHTEVHIPAAWRDEDEFISGVASQRSRNLDVVRDQLVGWLDTHDVGDDLNPAHVKQWRSPARFAALAIRWRDNPPEGGAQISETLEVWRKQDKHLWSIETGARSTLIRRRQDAYKKVAAWLTDCAALVIVDEMDVASYARTPAPENPDDRQNRRARSNRTLAAPAALRGLIETAAKQRGIDVVTPDGTYASVHADCGTELERGSDFAENVKVWCHTCEVMFDQDRSAANMLLTSTTGHRTG